MLTVSKCAVSDATIVNYRRWRRAMSSRLGLTANFARNTHLVVPKLVSVIISTIILNISWHRNGEKENLRGLLQQVQILKDYSSVPAKPSLCHYPQKIVLIKHLNHQGRSFSTRWNKWRPLTKPCGRAKMSSESSPTKGYLETQPLRNALIHHIMTLLCRKNGKVWAISTFLPFA